MKGFTLLELMVTLAIVGILTAAAIAGFTVMAANSKDSTAIREIYAQARQARQQARSRGQVVRMSVRDEVRDGVPRQIVRWERLPCADQWGGQCPTDACKATASACGVGCPCEATGDEVVAPRSEDLDLAALNGLCFRPNGLAYGSCSVVVDPALPPPAPVTQVRMTSRRNAAAKPFVMQLDSMTGSVRLKDCASQGAGGADAGC